MASLAERLNREIGRAHIWWHGQDVMSRHVRRCGRKWCDVPWPYGAPEPHGCTGEDLADDRSLAERLDVTPLDPS